MKVLRHQTFKKHYKKLREGEQRRVKERLALFLQNPFDPNLNNHPLKGRYSGCRSINIGGDLRAVYKLLADGMAFFFTINTHSNLYQ